MSSIPRFIEDNWLGGTRISGSADAMAGTLDNLFDFSAGAGDVAGAAPQYLDPTTGQATATPQPVLPEVPSVVALGGLGAGLLGAGVLVMRRRRQRLA